jgi:hypothetical protein
LCRSSQLTLFPVFLGCIISSVRNSISKAI